MFIDQEDRKLQQASSQNKIEKKWTFTNYNREIGYKHTSQMHSICKPFCREGWQV